jgi:hypothetical protein
MHAPLAAGAAAHPLPPPRSLPLPPQVPGAFLPASQKVNLSRLMELLGFALSHFTVGPDARRLDELVRATSGAAGAASQQRLQHSMLLDKVGAPGWWGWWGLGCRCCAAGAGACPESSTLRAGWACAGGGAQAASGAGSGA